MGLDITYGSRIERLDPQPDGDRAIDEAYETGAIRVYVHPKWPERAAELTSGFYLPNRAGGFTAGSYGGYNRWREDLALLMLGVAPRMVWLRPDEFAGAPFYELIAFSDAEGAIGAEVSAKLADDFRAHRSEARLAMSDREFDTYEEFSGAFHEAADNGVVCFR